MVYLLRETTDSIVPIFSCRDIIVDIGSPFDGHDAHTRSKCLEGLSHFEQSSRPLADSTHDLGRWVQENGGKLIEVFENTAEDVSAFFGL
ncbi:MAG: hypothetical protein HOE90_23385 [Bacteriovoracaceae bacterium]|nr:hypothetical protein [Bacteriovoracaceae bacterium]